MNAISPGTALHEPPAGRIDLPLRVVARSRHGDDVVVIDLQDAGGQAVPAWEPGAHLDLEVGDERLVRSYSLCGDHTDRTVLRIAVRREEAGRGGSAAVHDTVHPGTEVRAVGLRNHFALEPAQQYVFVAGGIGVTPLLPMIADVERRGLPWRLHYAGRSRRSMAFLPELEEAYGDRVDVWAKDEGRTLDLGVALSTASSQTGLYCCGPARMLEDFEARCASRGLTAHLERFEASDDAAAPRAGDAPFEVHLAQTGVTITVQPGESILDVAEQAGADVFGSCLEGICGTCETRVIDGVPDHRDAVLSGEPTGTMMICVSRSACPLLTLDA